MTLSFCHLRRGRNMFTVKAALGMQWSEVKPHARKLFRDVPETPSRCGVMHGAAARYLSGIAPQLTKSIWSDVISTSNVRCTGCTQQWQGAHRSALGEESVGEVHCELLHPGSLHTWARGLQVSRRVSGMAR